MAMLILFNRLDHMLKLIKIFVHKDHICSMDVPMGFHDPLNHFNVNLQK